MKLKGFYQDRSAQLKTISGVDFYIKPMSQSLFILTNAKMAAMNNSLLSFSDKIDFCRSGLLEGWGGLFYEDGSEVEFSVENAEELLCKEEYQSLFSELFLFSYELAKKLDAKAVEDEKTAKK